MLNGVDIQQTVYLGTKNYDSNPERFLLHTDKKRILVLISVGFDYHEGNYLRATVDLLKRLIRLSQQLKTPEPLSETPLPYYQLCKTGWEFKIVIGDRLQAYNNLLGKSTLQEAQLKWDRRGEEWRKIAEPIYEELKQSAEDDLVSIKFIHWKEFFDENGKFAKNNQSLADQYDYQRHYDELVQWYNENQEFKLAVDDKINRFKKIYAEKLKNEKVSNEKIDDILEWISKNAVRYNLEEKALIMACVPKGMLFKSAFQLNEHARLVSILYPHYEVDSFKLAREKYQDSKDNLFQLKCLELTLPAKYSKRHNEREFGKRILGKSENQSENFDFEQLRRLSHLVSGENSETDFYGSNAEILVPYWGYNENNYIHRNDEYSELESYLTDDETVKVACIGDNGMGVSSIVKEYYFRSINRYSERFWFVADKDVSEAELQYDTAVKQFLRSKNILYATIDDARAAVKTYFENTANYLLIIEEATDYQSIRFLLPEKSGHVLVTTRTLEWPEFIVPLRIDEFKVEESVDLFRKMNIYGSNEKIEYVCDKVLKNKPRDVAEACLLLADDTTVSLDDVICDTEYTEIPVNARKGNKLLNHINLTVLDNIKNTSELTRDYLYLLAQFRPNQKIPLLILYHWYFIGRTMSHEGWYAPIERIRMHPHVSVDNENNIVITEYLKQLLQEQHKKEMQHFDNDNAPFPQKLTPQFSAWLKRLFRAVKLTEPTDRYEHVNDALDTKQLLGQVNKRIASSKLYLMHVQVVYLVKKWEPHFKFSSKIFELKVMVGSMHYYLEQYDLARLDFLKSINYLKVNNKQTITIRSIDLYQKLCRIYTLLNEGLAALKVNRYLTKLLEDHYGPSSEKIGINLIHRAKIYSEVLRDQAQALSHYYIANYILRKNTFAYITYSKEILLGNGISQYRLGDYTKAEKSLCEYINTVLPEQSRYVTQLLQCYILLSKIYNSLNKHDKEKVYFLKANNLFEQYKESRYQLSSPMLDIAVNILQQQLTNSQFSDEHYQFSVSLCDSLGRTFGRNHSLLGIVYYLQALYCFSQENYKEFLTKTQCAIEVFRKNENITQNRKAHLEGLLNDNALMLLNHFLRFGLPNQMYMLFKSAASSNVKKHLLRMLMNDARDNFGIDLKRYIGNVKSEFRIHTLAMQPRQLFVYLLKNDIIAAKKLIEVSKPAKQEQLLDMIFHLAKKHYSSGNYKGALVALDLFLSDKSTLNLKDIETTKIRVFNLTIKCWFALISKLYEDADFQNVIQYSDAVFNIETIHKQCMSVSYLKAINILYLSYQQSHRIERAVALLKSTYARLEQFGLLSISSSKPEAVKCLLILANHCCRVKEYEIAKSYYYFIQKILSESVDRDETHIQLVHEKIFKVSSLIARMKDLKVDIQHKKNSTRSYTASQLFGKQIIGKLTSADNGVNDPRRNITRDLSFVTP